MSMSEVYALKEYSRRVHAEGEGDGSMEKAGTDGKKGDKAANNIN